jgi:hypothetical protein
MNKSTTNLTPHFDFQRELGSLSNLVQDELCSSPSSLHARSSSDDALNGDPSTTIAGEPK